MVAMSEDFGDKIDAFLYADASAAIGVAGREGLGRIRHLDTQSLWLQQALRQRRLGLGKVLGTENPSDLMTKHVDAKLLGEHVRAMGCEFKDGRAELAPQVVQQLEDVVDHVEDVPSGLMTASVSNGVATYENHCATDSEMCQESNSFDRQLADTDCQGGDEAKGMSFKCRWEDSSIDRDYEKGMLRDERLRGHPNFSFTLPFGQFCMPFGQSRSRGGACFSTILSHRLSIHVSERCYLYMRDVQQFTIFP